jgi:hypothetical protein
MGREQGQATVEAVAAIPLLLLAGAVALHLLVAGYVLTLADGAAEAGALALAAGQPAKGAVEDSLPGWAADEVEVEVRGGEVEVSLRPPPLPGLDVLPPMTSTAFARPARR